MVAPVVSSARWKPKLAPMSSGGVESRMSASRGAVRTAFPVRSTSRPARTRPQCCAAATAAREIAVSVYPPAIHGHATSSCSVGDPARHRSEADGHAFSDPLDEAEDGHRGTEDDREEERDDRVGELARDVVHERDHADCADVCRDPADPLEHGRKL